MALFSTSSSSFNLQRLSAPSLPPRLIKVTTKAFERNTSSSHLILSSALLRSTQLSSSSFCHQCKDEKITPVGLSKNLQVNRSNSSVKISSDQVGDISEDKPLTITKKANMLEIAIRFVRPYILIGTSISFLATTARAFFDNPHLTLGSVLTWNLAFRGLLALSVLFGIDAYIMVMNQISDVEIDRINKPYLPLASGEISLRDSWTLVISSVIHSIATAVLLDRKALLPMVLHVLGIGTIYSVRPFYTKRSTIGAILTCGAMRGYGFTLVHYAAACATLGVGFRLGPGVVFISVFATLLGMTIGIMKDLPDLEGDKECNVKTLALMIGAEKTASIGFGLLFLAYAGSVAAAICLPSAFRASVAVPAHLLLGSLAAFQCWKLVKANYSKEASKAFFQFLWTLLNAEIIIFPFI